MDNNDCESAVATTSQPSSPAHSSTESALARLRDEVCELLKQHSDPDMKPPFIMMKLITIGAVMLGRQCVNIRKMPSES